jgi:hypothetical protein
MFESHFFQKRTMRFWAAAQDDHTKSAEGSSKYTSAISNNHKKVAI